MGHTVAGSSHPLHHLGAGLEIGQFGIHAFGHQQLTIHAEGFPASLGHGTDHEGPGLLQGDRGHVGASRRVVSRHRHRIAGSTGSGEQSHLGIGDLALCLVLHADGRRGRRARGDVGAGKVEQHGRIGAAAASGG